MALKTLTTTELVSAYLGATGDSLTTATCRALELPTGRHFLFDLRRRLAYLSCPGGVHSGVVTANQGKGSGLTTAATLKLVIDKLPEAEFSTADIRERINLRSATLSKALRALEHHWVIERLPSPRPYRYRRLAQARRNFVSVFMEAHRLCPSSPANLSLGHLPLLANRAMCGLTIEATDLAMVTTDSIARYSGKALPVPPLPALIPMLLAILNSSGDTRSALRGLRTALQEAEAVTRCWTRLPPEEAKESPLAAFRLPDEWLALLSTQGGLGAFIEAGTQALGGELYPVKAAQISENAIRETIKTLKATGVAVVYDESKKLLTGLERIDVKAVEVMIRCMVVELARKAALPVWRVSVEELYRRAAKELLSRENS